MIPVPSNVRVWLAVGRTDMRRGMNGLALQVQEALRQAVSSRKPSSFGGQRSIQWTFLAGLFRQLYGLLGIQLRASSCAAVI
jgi:hypothetical protein